MLAINIHKGGGGSGDQKSPKSCLCRKSMTPRRLEQTSILQKNESIDLPKHRLKKASHILPPKDLPQPKKQ